MPCPILAWLSSAPEVSILSPAPTFPNTMSANLLLILRISVQMPLLWRVFLAASSDGGPLLWNAVLCCVAHVPEHSTHHTALSPKLSSGSRHGNKIWKEDARDWVPSTGSRTCGEIFLECFIEWESIFTLGKIKMKKNIQCWQGLKLWYFYPLLVGKVIWQHLIQAIKMLYLLNVAVQPWRMCSKNHWTSIHAYLHMRSRCSLIIRWKSTLKISKGAISKQWVNNEIFSNEPWCIITIIINIDCDYW